MFLRIDKDLFVNVNNIFSYKLFDEGDSYKLLIWSTDGKIGNTVYYLKNSPEQMNILREVVDNLREFTLNPERLIYPTEPVVEEPVEEPVEEEPVESTNPEPVEERRIQESFSVPEAAELDFIGSEL